MNESLKSIIIFALSGYLIASFVTNSWRLNFESRWFYAEYIKHRLMHPTPLVLSEQELALYNGSDPNLPIYLAINGSVFDVSTRRETYGPIGPYRFFSGKDAARAFATGCFQTDLTHDLRGLSENELESIRGWTRYFDESTRYWPVGVVTHGPLSGDPPKPCRGAQKPT